VPGLTRECAKGKIRRWSMALRKFISDKDGSLIARRGNGSRSEILEDLERLERMEKLGVAGIYGTGEEVVRVIRGE
jgi:hypothetical protein